MRARVREEVGWCRVMTSEVVGFISDVVFSTSEVVGFISDAVLWFLVAHRGKRGQELGGMGRKVEIELMSDFCEIEASKSRRRIFF